MIKLRLGLFSLALCVLAMSALRADTLRLRDGRTIEGDFVDGTPRQIRFMEKDGVLKVYAIHEMRSIVFGEAPAPTAGGPPPAVVPLSCFGPLGRPSPAHPRLPLIPARARPFRYHPAPSLLSR